MSTIRLECPKCKQYLHVARTEHDFPDAVKVELQCPECNAGDFAEPMYFNAAGEHINRDPQHMTPNACSTPVSPHNTGNSGVIRP